MLVSGKQVTGADFHSKIANFFTFMIENRYWLLVFWKPAFNVTVKEHSPSCAAIFFIFWIIFIDEKAKALIRR